MMKQKSKVVATYSKRKHKQFRRIVKDNWQEPDNVFSTSATSGQNNSIPLQLHSTPITKKVRQITKPKDSFGTSPDSQLDDRYPLKDLSHPRQVSGKRACRRPPILNLTPEPEPQQEAIDKTPELFDSSTKTSDKENKSPESCLQISDDEKMTDILPSPKEILSEQHQEISPASLSFALSEFSSQFITTVGDTKCNFDIESIPVRAEDNNTSHENASSPSAMEVSMNFSFVKSEEQMLSLDLSKMSVKENDEHSIRESNKNEESPTRLSYLNESEVSPIKVSESNEKFESPMKVFQSNKKDESSVKTSAQSEEERLVDEQSLEMSIQEVVKEEKIAALDRSLMLATTIPSYTKLLSQCRRVKDLQTLVQSDMNCIRKIGEGSFGEVFMGQDTVYKVVPVGGDQEINDVEQTTFENAFQEIAVSRKLSDLAGDQVQMGKAFCQLKDVVFCKGKYPEVLLTAWDNFQGTENQRPDILPEDQMYVVLLCKYSGVQLEEYCAAHKLTPYQAHSIVRQICCSLAAAEQLYEFEHRDLHWGNVLIAETDMEHVEFTQDGKTYILKSHGLLATVIDFTFSRLETEGCLNYVDLEHEDWLFQGDVKTDIQYRVYRDMRSACRKNWAKFTPKTNLLWLLYLIDKMNIKIRSSKLRHLKQALQSCKSSSAALPIAFRSL